MIIRLQPLILALLLFAFATTQAGLDPFQKKLPVMQVMPGAKVQWVAEHMILNGVPMSSRTFISSRKPERVLDFYRNRWKIKNLGRISESTSGDYKIIGIEHKDYYHSVQVKKSPTGSEGLLTVTRSLLNAQAKKETQFPKMINTQVISVIQSLDFGTRAETIIMTNNRTVHSNALHIHNSLKSQGWVYQNFGQQKQNNKQQLLHFQNGKQNCQVTITSNDPSFPGRTMILVNWIKN